MLLVVSCYFCFYCYCLVVIVQTSLNLSSSENVETVIRKGQEHFRKDPMLVPKHHDNPCFVETNNPINQSINKSLSNQDLPTHDMTERQENLTKEG